MGRSRLVRFAFTAHLRRAGDDAAAYSARRARSARADRKCVEVLSRAEAAREDGRARHPPARRTRVLRTHAGARGDAAELRLVQTIHCVELTLSEDRLRQ